MRYASLQLFAFLCLKCFVFWPLYISAHLFWQMLFPAKPILFSSEIVFVVMFEKVICHGIYCKQLFDSPPTRRVLLKEKSWSMRLIIFVLLALYP